MGQYVQGVRLSLGLVGFPFQFPAHDSQLLFALVLARSHRNIGGTWDKITLAAGCPDLFFHDLRRSAVRNMVRAGIPESVCMKVSGHKTRNIFERYNITSEKDLADAARKIELSYRQAKNEAEQNPEQGAEVKQHDTIQ